MRTKSLQRKRALRTALLVLLLSAAGMGKGYAQNISFADSRVKALCVDNWDTNGDGELSYAEAASVTSLGSVFKFQGTITAFDELQYFTGLTEIGYMSFYRCSVLASVIIPNSVTNIQDAAFTNCSSLTSITIPCNITAIGRAAFQNCSDLVTLNFNATNCTSAASGGEYNGVYYGSIFDGCTSFTTINIGANVQRIPSNLLNGCNSLTSVNICDINAWWNITFEANPLWIAHNLYLNGELVTNLVTPETVSEIKPNTFAGATCVTNLTFHNSIISIGENAFSGCSNLEGPLTIPESVEFIGDFAFKNCTSITEINYNAINCQSIGWVNLAGVTAFTGCSSITSIKIGNNVQSIPHHAFAFLSLSRPLDLIIPNSVVSIGLEAFLNCSNLVSVSIGNSVVSIGDYAFVGTELSSITIGNSVANIGNGAFSNCSNLNTIIALGTIPPTLGTDTFSSISPVATLFVPCGSQMAYFTNWNIFDYNNIHEDCTPRPVSVDSNITGGSVIPSASQATMGQEVTIVVTPNSGMHLASIIAYNTTNPSQIVPISPIGNSYEFVMPPHAVTISATFESTNTLLEESYSIEANIYPNPTNGLVKIEAENIRQICISNMLGQVIYNSNTSNNKFEYDFDQHGEGLYLIRIETANGIITKRIAVTQ